jgi:hypothetical protein
MSKVEEAAAWVGEVLALMDVHRDASDHGTLFPHIKEAAMARLREINESLAPAKEPPAYEPTAFDKAVPPRDEVPRDPNVIPEPITEDPVITDTPVIERRGA